MSSRLPRQPFLYPILDTILLRGRDVSDAIGLLAAEGAELFQLRAKNTEDREFLSLAQRATEAAHRAGARLIVNDRPDIARLCEADGVHLGQTDLPAEEVRAFLGDAAILGVSTHTRGQVELASTLPVDYVAIGPIFQTRTKAEPDPIVGCELLAAARLKTALPLVAIGGIGLETLRPVASAGASGIALASAIFGGEDIVSSYRALRARLL